jgi:peptidoglycan/xylan/chitin deacetylase (PgdA/CDA1 family)
VGYTHLSYVHQKKLLYIQGSDFTYPGDNMSIFLSRRHFLKMGCAAMILSALRPKSLFAGIRKIPVLMYHDISHRYKDAYTIPPSNFAVQMEWLYSHGYKAVSISEIDKFTGADDDKVVVITFDDGYSSFIEYAYPRLKEYDFKANINIIGSNVGTFINFYGNRPMLSWDEYRFLVNSGSVYLGSHTYNLHPCSLHSKSGALSISDKELENDLLLFNDILKKETGKITEVLAWPCGTYNRKSISVARKAGFKYFLTSNEGYFGRRDSLHEIPRLNINNKLDLISFQEYIGAKK